MLYNKNSPSVPSGMLSSLQLVADNIATHHESENQGAETEKGHRMFPYLIVLWIIEGIMILINPFLPIKHMQVKRLF